MNHKFQIIPNRLLASDEGHGITRRSLEVVKNNQKKLGDLYIVEMVNPKGKEACDSVVRLFNADLDYIEVSGFTWGYSGEGPHGLVKALEMFNCPITIYEVTRLDGDHYILYPNTTVFDSCNCPWS